MSRYSIARAMMSYARCTMSLFSSSRPAENSALSKIWFAIMPAISGRDSLAVARFFTSAWRGLISSFTLSLLTSCSIARIICRMWLVMCASLLKATAGL